MPAVVHPVRSLFVVALGDLADPVGPVANDGGELGRGVALGKEPQDLPPGSHVGLLGRTVPVFELVDAQVGVKMYVSSHDQILP